MSTLRHVFTVLTGLGLAGLGAPALADPIRTVAVLSGDFGSITSVDPAASRALVELHTVPAFEGDVDHVRVVTVDLTSGAVLDDWRPRLAGQLPDLDSDAGGRVIGADLDGAAMAGELVAWATRLRSLGGPLDEPDLAVTPDRRHILYQAGDWVFVAGGDGHHPLPLEPGRKPGSFDLALSPDGRWLAYESCAPDPHGAGGCSDTFDLLVRELGHLEGPPLRLMRDVNPTDRLHWRADSSAIYVLGGGSEPHAERRGCLLRVRIELPAPRPAVYCEPDLEKLTFVPSPDGRTGILRGTAEPSESETVIDWIDLATGALRAQRRVAGFDSSDTTTVSDSGLVFAPQVVPVPTRGGGSRVARRLVVLDLATGRAKTVDGEHYYYAGRWLGGSNLLALRSHTERGGVELVRLDVGALLGGP